MYNSVARSKFCFGRVVQCCGTEWAMRLRDLCELFFVASVVKAFGWGCAALSDQLCRAVSQGLCGSKET